MTITKNSRGFTIVEFMMATVVFSVVLMGVTGAILQMTKNYQKSRYVANTQSVAAEVLQTVSQSVKFNGSAALPQGSSGDIKSYCVGNRMFVFVIGRRMTSTESITPTNTRHALVTAPSGSCSIPNIITTANLSSDSKELLGQGMRLVKFSIGSVAGSNIASVTVRVVYGEDDLLCRDDAGDSCQRGGRQLTEAELKAGGDIRCRPGSGSEYCAVSELTTLVQPGL